MLDALKDKLEGAVDAVENAADAVADTVRDGGIAVLTKAAEKEIKEHTGSDIDFEVQDVPSDWKEWVMKTGINSICTGQTWRFLEESQYNQRKVDLWKERGIKKIIMGVKEDPEEYSGWKIADVEWSEGETEFKILWYPRAGNWHSDNTWVEPGHKRWWGLDDEIVFGLQLYQLPGKCFYKSDWVENFEDVDPDSFFPNGKTTYKRWLQFRHWSMMWYARAMSGWNWAWAEKPPSLPDGSDFSLDAVLSLPSMPDISMPEIKLPDLPDVSLPSIEAPTIEAPSLSAPSIDPSLSMPSMDARKKRPKNPWAAHGIIELGNLHAIAKGSKLILSGATIHHFWEDDNGHIDTEKKEDEKLELKCTSDEQADSWVDTLIAVGVKNDEVGGCCTVA